MPLSVNVGLSRKRSKDYQSEGVSINLTAELDQSLLARPEELQQQIDGLYQQAEAALDRQVSVPQSQPQPRQQQHQRSQPNRSGGYNRSARSQGNGKGDHHQQQQPSQSNGTGNGNGRPNAGTMTESQKRAINAIARRLNLDATYECQQVFGWELDKLTIKQASELIDHLKAQTSDDTRR